jgi:hypothetical protein
MTTLIIILAYIANIFLARFFNKLLFKLDENFNSIPIIWFIPLIGLVSYSVIYLIESSKSNNRSNWFTVDILPRLKHVGFLSPY